MWIEVSNDFCDDLEINPTGSSDTICDGLSLGITNLLMMMMKNRHIVFFSYVLLEKIINNPTFAHNTRQYAKYVKKNYTYIYSGRSNIKHKIIVDKSLSITKNGTYYFVPISYFYDEKKMKLVVEHESDCFVYKGIYKYIKKNKAPNSYYDICFENDSCHGSNVAPKIEEIANENNMGILFLDSDQDFYGGAMGETYKKAAKEIKNYSDKIIDLNVLTVREKENLFSPGMYAPFCVEESKRDFLKKLENFKNKDIYYYFDIKDGIKYQKYKDPDWEKHYHSYIPSFISSGILKIRDDLKSDDLCTEFIGDKLCDTLCKTFLMASDSEYDYKQIEKDYGKFNASDILDIRKNISRFLPSDLYLEWERIYEILGDWGISIADKYKYRIA